MGFWDQLRRPQEGDHTVRSVSKDQIPSKVKSGGLCPCQWAVSRRMGLAEITCRHVVLAVGGAGFEHIPLRFLARTYGSSSAAVKGSRP